MTEDKSQKEKSNDYSFRVDLVRSWHEEQIVDLYRAAGWWKEEMDASKINDLIRGSFLFAVAIDISTGRAVGMGRVISDGIADAYIQDLVVLGRLEELGCGENDSQQAFGGVQISQDHLDRPDSGARQRGILSIPGICTHARTCAHALS